MADKIGVLGESSVLTGTATAYTVPSGKAAKVKIMYRIQGAVAADSTLAITVNGLQILLTAVLGNSFYQFSNVTNMATAAQAAAPLGTTPLLTVAPGPHEYFLSAGDTITYTVGGSDLLAASFQVVGSEIDVT